MTIRPENLLKYNLPKNERVLASEHLEIGQDPPIDFFDDVARFIVVSDAGLAK